MSDRDVIPSDVRVLVRVRPVAGDTPRAVVQAEMVYTMGVDDVVRVPLDPRWGAKRSYVGGGKFLVRNIHREQEVVRSLFDAGVRWYSQLPDVVELVQRNPAIATVANDEKPKRKKDRGAQLRTPADDGPVFDRVVKPGRVVVHPEGWGEVVGREAVELWVDHVPRWKSDGWEVEAATHDVWNLDPLRAALHVRVDGQTMLVEGQLTVGRVMLSPHDLRFALSRGHKWAYHRGRAVPLPQRADLGFLADAAEKQVAVQLGDSGKIAPLLQGVLDASVAEGCKLIIQALIAATGPVQPSPHLTATLRDYQVYGMRWLQSHYDAGMGCLLADSMGVGKAQPLRSMVATPAGWRPIGELRVGDEVIGRDGRPTKVTGVFPQGVKPVYRVTFNDSYSTLCCAEHLWAARSPQDKFSGKPFRVVSTQDIMDRGLRDCNRNLRWYIPMVEPVQYEARNLPLDPYLVGALVANANFGTTIGYSGSAAQVDLLKPYLPEPVEARQCGEWEYRLAVQRAGQHNPLRKILVDLGLAGHLANAKFIPAEYMSGSVEQRLALLQGLCDGDGCVNKEGIIVEYNTVSPKLAAQVVEIVQSLGGVALMSKRIPKFTYKGERKEGQMDHRVRISLPPGFCPFRLPAKADRFRPRTKYQPNRGIVSIEPEGDEECVCIAVDAPDHLYVTENYIVTHNTVQCLAMLANVYDANSGKLRALVVCPTSLIANWSNEIVKFTKHFHVLRWEGTNRKVNETRLGDYNIVLTSYQTLLRDNVAFQQIPWDIAILDEAQQVKNSDSKTWAEVCALKPRRRLAITGTPIENNLGELYAIMEFAVPGLLGTQEQFEEAFVEPIKNEDREAMMRLRQLVSPFILRRTKEEVAHDLPDKEIIDYMCPMTLPQKQAYDAMFEDYRQQLRTALSVDRGRFFALMLAATTRLRQMATDPRLSPQGAQFRADHSGKMVAFRTLAGKKIAAGSKVLVFSQWTEMLSLLKQEAERCKWSYCYLDGSTKDRQAEVDRFQNTPDVKVFFISLNAGGVGLNLTAADTVIIVDPWWNPAKEAQAMDRAHRIGQKQNVYVYRLLAEDTIEANIATMQANKAFLASSVLDADMPDEQVAQNRNSEIQRLFGLLD